MLRTGGKMSEIWEKEEDIPYREIGRRMFPPPGDDSGPEQHIVPFLGAGVSVSARTNIPGPMPPQYPSRETMEKVCGLLGVGASDEETRRDLEYAVRTALWMKVEREHDAAATEELAQRLLADPYPPFAWELAEVLAQEAAFTSFQDRPLRALEQHELLPRDRRPSNAKLVAMVKLLAGATGVNSSSDPLASIAGFFEYKTERDSLYKLLARHFRPKTRPTPTHGLIARAARWHLARPMAEDYLIVTTNYDALMEKALAQLEVPHVVISVDRDKRDAHARFAQLTPEELRILNERHKPAPARQFQFNKHKSMAIVFKMHGCMNPEVQAPDGIVITEEDYVSFITNLNDTVPQVVGSILPTKRLLFLGYSFSDWNVRGVYETVRRRSGARLRDYAVTKALSAFEREYFKRKDIALILQDLGTFTDRLSTAEPPPPTRPAAAV
jgi:hypothetical protein